jgi:hypothetical protein
MAFFALCNCFLGKEPWDVSGPGSILHICLHGLSITQQHPTCHSSDLGSFEVIVYSWGEHSAQK